MSPTPIGGGAGGGTGGTPLRNVLYMALRLGGVTLGPGRTPSVDQLGDAFLLVNLMIGAWATKRRMPFYNRIDRVTLSAATSYTVGSGADWDIPRPFEILRAVPVNTSASPNIYGPGLSILDDVGWSQVALQSQSGTTPYALYYDKSFDPETGFATAYLVGQSTSDYALDLYTKALLLKFQSLDDNVFLPDGYEGLITDNLAVMISSIPAWGGAVSQDTRNRARIGLADMESRNAPRPPRLNGDSTRLSENYGWYGDYLFNR